MGRYKDISGKRFGNLTVLKISHRTDKDLFWECVCDCGEKCSVVFRIPRLIEVEEIFVRSVMIKNQRTHL